MTLQPPNPSVRMIHQLRLGCVEHQAACAAGTKGISFNAATRCRIETQHQSSNGFDAIRGIATQVRSRLPHTVRST